MDKKNEIWYADELDELINQQEWRRTHSIECISLIPKRTIWALMRKTTHIQCVVFAVHIIQRYLKKKEKSGEKTRKKCARS